MGGRQVAITDADLDGLVRAHGSADPAPVVVGHPEADAPAYGWVDGVRRVGDRLQVRLRDLDPSFRSAVEAGRYAGRSVALDRAEGGGWHLRHLGFLGGVAPAVPGLAPTRFAGEADMVIEFAAAEFAATSEERWAWGAVGRMMRRLREWLIEAHGVEKADGIVSEHAIEVVAGAEREPDTPASTARMADQPAQRGPGEAGSDGEAFFGGRPAGPTDRQQDREGEMTEQEKAEMEAARRRLGEDREALAAREAAFAERERQRGAEEEVQGHVKAGRVLPVEAPGLAALLASLPGDEGAELVFAATQPGVDCRRVAPREYLQEFLAGLPTRVVYEEVAGPGTAPRGGSGQEPEEVARAARALMAADESGELRIDQAVRQVLGERGQGNV